MARKVGQGEWDHLAPRGRGQHHKTRHGHGHTCTLSLCPLLNWLWAWFMLVLTLCCSWEWSNVLLRGPESGVTRRRGTMAYGGQRSSGGWRVRNRGSQAVVMRGMSKRTNASRGARWAKAWRSWCMGDRGSSRWRGVIMQYPTKGVVGLVLPGTKG